MPPDGGEMPFLRSSSIVAGIRLRLVEAGLTSIGSMGKHKFGGQKIVIGAIEIDTRRLRLIELLQTPNRIVSEPFLESLSNERYAFHYRRWYRLSRCRVVRIYQIYIYIYIYINISGGHTLWITKL